MMQERQKQKPRFLEVRTNTNKIPLSSNNTTASNFQCQIQNYPSLDSFILLSKQQHV
jgi:hypothetical protein